MILSASRKKAVCFSLKADAAAIYEAIQELFEDLGGVTLELLIDNPTALVIENNPRNEMEIRYNPHALLMARHLGTELNACPCYWPRKKGKIERPFNYIEEQFIKGNHFASMEDLNRRGKDFVESWCNETHTTTKRIPNIHYLQEERDLLLPLPDRRYRLKELESRIISPDCYISIGGNKYSVPDIFAAKTMYFRIIYGFRIELYDRKKNYVMKLEASRNKHEILTNSEHYKNVAPKAPTSIPQIRREFTARYSNGLAYLKQPGKSLTSPHITQERSCCSKNFMIQIPSIVLLDMQYSMILWTSCHLKNCSKLTMQAGCLFLRYLNRDRKFCVKPENTVTMIQNFCGIWITMNRMWEER
ncbi:MAG: Mu transposase domain-containing protein [Ruminococcus sp.]